MKQTGILFSSSMVRALLTCVKCGKISVPFPCEHCGSTEFVKTQTRRLIRWTPRPDCVICNGKGYEFIDCENELSDYDYSEPCRCITDKCRYREGVMLWTKETYHFDAYPENQYDAQGRSGVLHYRADLDPVSQSWEGLWESGFSMPKSACRLWLIITGTRDQRVQDISEEDAKAEGVSPENAECNCPGGAYKNAFCGLWDKLYAKHNAWKWNPWVRAISFHRTNKENR